MIGISKRESLCCCASLLLWSAGAFGQSLQVTSPSSGLTFAPGDDINITVSAEGSFKSVTVVGQDIGTAPLRSAPPYVFSLTTPNEISGSRTLTAVGFTSTGGTVFSDPVSINVESAAGLVALKANLTSIRFRYVGQQIRVAILGIFSDSSLADISRSSRITYISANSSVVVAGSDGTLTATGAGQTNVVVAYDTLSQTLAVSVVEETSAPVISGLPSADCGLWPPNHKLVQVAVVTATAPGSDLRSFDVTGTSNEPSDPNNPDIVIRGSGVGARVIQLRADRLGTGAGRTYSLAAVAVNEAGALRVSKATCIVPHDKGR